jgi:hypothetical protein
MTQIEALPLNQTTHCHVIREQVFFFHEQAKVQAYITNLQSKDGKGKTGCA